MICQANLLPFVGLMLSLVSAAPTSNYTDTPRQALKLTINHEGPLEPRIDSDFPDPSITQAKDGSWVALATNGNGKQFQIATAKDLLGKWTLKDYDAMPDLGWTNGEEMWAPDLRTLDNGQYIFYYSGRLATGNHEHCIGVARSDKIAGVYKPDARPIVCPPEGFHGVIDAAGFKDPETDKRYIVYKLEGDVSKPTGGTPLMLQEVEENGSTLIGEPVKILDRIEEEDGILVEAPNIVRLGNGLYVLFYSSHRFDDPAYAVKYAFSDKVSGPYERAPESLIKKPDFGLDGPGGMTSNEAGDTLVFHGWCGEERNKRCMYSVAYSYS
ncbi:hypothetical protein FDECE_8921 [Fusarium decemcellulare]|nr:hypothetical protein FDECE_8921 [Fusarium decemcellulare]